MPGPGYEPGDGFVLLTFAIILCCAWLVHPFLASRKSTYHFHQHRHGFARFIGWGFIACGGFFLITMFVGAERLKTTQYVVTDQRVLVVSGNPIRHVDSVFLSNLDEVGLETYADGTGTIRFGADSYYKQLSQTYVNGNWQTEERKVWILAPRLERIAEVSKLHELILKARRDALAQRSSGTPPQ